MYVTRPLSLYRKSPDALSLPPPEGPNSGYLVLQDEESETTSCFGLCKERDIRDLPFPQDKNLTVRYSTVVAGDISLRRHTNFLRGLLHSSSESAAVSQSILCYKATWKA